jgi:alkylhydroperoxidase family enzyme
MPVDVSDALFAAMHKHFDEAQLVELTHHTALETCVGV